MDNIYIYICIYIWTLDMESQRNSVAQYSISSVISSSCSVYIHTCMIRSYLMASNHGSPGTAIGRYSNFGSWDFQECSICISKVRDVHQNSLSHASHCIPAFSSCKSNVTIPGRFRGSRHSWFLQLDHPPLHNVHNLKKKGADPRCPPELKKDFFQPNFHTAPPWKSQEWTGWT